MRIGFFLYKAFRLLFGMFLVLFSTYNVIGYSEFLNRVDQFFNNVRVFDIEFIETLAPLVPFVEFVIGMFLTLGIFTRKVLIATIILFTFLIVFLLDANYWYCACAHFILWTIAIILLKMNHYDRNSMSYNKDSYQII